MSTQNKKIGVVIMTYGSATTAEHVAEYFERIYPGKVSAELIADFENRYRLVGHSPLVEITQQQAALLQKKLGGDYIVRAGMRHSAPFIEDAVAQCRAAGATSLMGIILSPQFSSFIMDGYTKTFMETAKQHGFDQGYVAIVPPWGTEPHFIELLTREIQDSLAALNAKYGPVPVIFTTHSLPQRVVDKDPNYLTQLRATIDAVREKLDPNLVWFAAYQSAGHTPEEWLKPDLTDILKNLRDQKTPTVLIVPIQFLADHLEILYDLDTAARKQCEAFGIVYNRTQMPNTNPLFIEALASLVVTALT